MSELSRAGIARSDINFFDFETLGQLPDQGMLPSPTTNNQYLQRLLPVFKILFINLTPCIPLSFLGEGGGRVLKGLRPFKLKSIKLLHFWPVCDLIVNIEKDIHFPLGVGSISRLFNCGEGSFYAASPGNCFTQVYYVEDISAIFI